MVVVAGKVTIKPEKWEEAVQAGLQMAESTRAEPGCLSYHFSAALEDPNIFFLFAEWEDEAVLAHHYKTEHMKEFQQRLGELIEGELNLRWYIVESVTTI